MASEVKLSGYIVGGNEVKNSKNDKKYLVSEIEAGDDVRSCRVEFVCFGPVATQLARNIDPKVKVVLTGKLSVDSFVTQAGKEIRNLKVIVHEFNIPMAEESEVVQTVVHPVYQDRKVKAPEPEVFEEDLPF